jgi:peptide/nickel transport system substrate-binding protein
LVIYTPLDIGAWDPYSTAQFYTMMPMYLEQLTAPDWTLNPTVFANNTNWIPTNYISGDLMQSWEFPSPTTMVVHLHQGIYWQNISPVNGREFTSADVVWNYDREFGKGGGFTTPSPYATTVSQFANMQSVTAIDTFTVSFQWASTTSFESISEALLATNAPQCMVAPEAVNLWGNVNNWQHAIGTGPFIVSDFVDSTSMTLVKNPNYWWHDERYPQNQLPYVNGVNVLIIVNQPTALAAMRAGKIDEMEGLSIQTAQAMQQTNPQILQVKAAANTGGTVDMRHDVAPFNNLQVREALQMSLDLPTICSTYFESTCPPYPVCLTTQYMTGWGFPYSQWSPALQAQYAYNPTTAKQLLAQAGYPNGFTTDVVADTASDLALLQIVQSYFAAIGVNMSIQTMTSPAWVSYVQVNHSYDAMAYRAGGSIGTSSGPLRQLSYFVTGASTNWQLINDPNLNADYAQALTATTTAQIQQLLQAANETLAEQHYMVCLLQSSSFTFYQPWLGGFTGQFSSFYGTPYGPSYPGFYSARVWIKQ